MFIYSYVFTHSIIHSLQVKFGKLEESTYGGLSEVRRKAAETRSAALLQTI